MCFTVWRYAGRPGPDDLDPQNPVVLTMWHNPSGQMKHAMSDVVDEFNRTLFDRFAFFMLLVMTMVVGVASLLLITGTVSTGVGENRRLMENELAYLSQSVERQFGEISAQALRLSRHIARNVEGRLREKDLDVDDLRRHPELLEGIVDDQYDTLFFSMERVKASGAFMTLNATVSKRPQEAPEAGRRRRCPRPSSPSSPAT